ncbi:MAG TPA: response regulator [Thermoanaerobaculia bacterium]
MADGDAAIRSLLSAVVTRMELEPVVVPDGETAAALLAERQFGAVVIDSLLPGLSGDEIVARLGEENPEMVGRTIVITTLPQPWVMRKCGGVAAVLRKPFALDEIQEAIRRCCSR